MYPLQSIEIEQSTFCVTKALVRLGSVSLTILMGMLLPAALAQQPYVVSTEIEVVSGPLNVRDRFGLSANVISQVQVGETGKVLAGPENSDGIWWWAVVFASGAAGWVAEGSEGVVYLSFLGEQVGNNGVPSGSGVKTDGLPGPVLDTAARRSEFDMVAAQLIGGIPAGTWEGDLLSVSGEYSGRTKEPYPYELTVSADGTMAELQSDELSCDFSLRRADTTATLWRPTGVDRCDWISDLIITVGLHDGPVLHVAHTPSGIPTPQSDFSVYSVSPAVYVHIAGHNNNNSRRIALSGFLYDRSVTGRWDATHDSRESWLDYNHGNTFASKYGADHLVSCNDGFFANPFPFEGKIIAHFGAYPSMQTRDSATVSGCDGEFLLTGVPEGTVTASAATLFFVGRVVSLDNPRRPVIQLIAVTHCQEDYYCADFFPW